MWKNLAKGGIWFAIYFALQNILSILFAGISLTTQLDSLPELNDVDALTDFVMKVIMDAVMPTMIAASIAFIIIYLVHKKVIKQPLDIKKVDWQYSIFFIGVGLILNVCANSFLWIMDSIIPEAWLETLNVSIDAASTGQPMWMLILGTGILIPIMEELTFRYGIHKNIAQKNVVWAYIISSVLFGLMHGNPIQIVYATAFGFALAWVYQKTSNIWYPIILHMVNNTASLLGLGLESEIIYVLIYTVIGAGIIVLSYFCLPHVHTLLTKKMPQNSQIQP